MSQEREYEVVLLVKVHGFGKPSAEHATAYAVAKALYAAFGSQAEVWWHRGPHEGEQIVFDAAQDETAWERVHRE